MSTILEALRKSEAERAARSGAAPPPQLQPQPEPRRGWIGIVVALLVLVAAMLFMRFGRDDVSRSPPTNPVPSQAREGSRTLTTDVDDATTPIEPAPITSGAGHQPVPAEAVDADRPSAQQTSESSLATQTRPGVTADRDREAGSIVEGAPAQDVPGAPDEVEVVLESDDVQRPSALEMAEQSMAAQVPTKTVASGDPDHEAQPVMEDDPAPLATVDLTAGQVIDREPAMPAAGGRPADVPAAADENSPAQLPPVQVLGPGPVLRDLGALVVNVHKYAADPAARFLLINLRRRVEGDQIVRGVRIARILPDAVALEIEGRQYLWAPTR